MARQLAAAADGPGGPGGASRVCTRVDVRSLSVPADPSLAGSRDQRVPVGAGMAEHRSLAVRRPDGRPCAADMPGERVDRIPVGGIPPGWSVGRAPRSRPLAVGRVSRSRPAAEERPDGVCFRAMKARLAGSFCAVLLLAVSLAAQAPDSRAARMDKERDNAELQRVAAFKVFDNLSYVGIGWVGSWLVNTSQGLILIDTLEERYADHTLAGISRLGFKPTDIKYVLVLQGHF